MNSSRVKVALFIYSVYVLIVTFHPFELSHNFVPSLSHISAGLGTLLIDGWNWLGPKDFFLNIVLFLPCGALLPALWKDRCRSETIAIILVTLAGALASFLIEWGQVFAGRNSSMIDILSNTLGTAIGAFAYDRCTMARIRQIELLTADVLRSKVAVCCALAFAALPLAFSIEQSRAPFWRWDSGLTLQLGNEPSWNRPWLGKLYLVALYRRALSAEEIFNNFATGFSPEAAPRRTKTDLIALYTFSEGGGNIIRDTSRFEEPLDLRFWPGHRARWLDGSNGIEIIKRSIVKSQRPATKLVETVRATDELSVEVWMAPRDTAQYGPARVISLSRNSGSRNFTLGQEGATIDFRLRTPVSGSNGAPVLLRTENGTLTAGVVHVVATYKDGIERLYINGLQRPEKLNLATDGIVGFATRKTPVAQFAHSFVYFFPLSFLLSVFWSNRPGCSAWQTLIPVAAIAGISAITEVVQAFMLTRAIDSAAITYGMVIGIIGVLSSTRFASPRLESRGELCR
jgi:glycopeptide antibiotics resistance protein